MFPPIKLSLWHMGRIIITLNLAKTERGVDAELKAGAPVLSLTLPIGSIALPSE